jgi:hypothetical protein
MDLEPRTSIVTSATRGPWLISETLHRALRIVKQGGGAKTFFFLPGIAVT